MLLFSKKKFDTQVSKQAMETCEQIITEMGAEIHDDLIQKLSIFRLYLDRLERASNHSTELDTIIQGMRTDFESVIQSVRQLSRRLMPVSMEGDSFMTRLNLLCQNMERPGAGNIHFETLGAESVISDHAQGYLYRIVQELIHNAFKHSAAWHVWIRARWEPTSLSIEVEDDGTGFARISDFINDLKRKQNTLKMRSLAIGAAIRYEHGKKGLLAKINYPFKPTVSDGSKKSVAE